MRSGLVVLACSLTGCFGLYQLNRLPEPQPPGRPVSIEAPGPVLHAESGLRLAESYADFQRVAATRYDSAGLDVGIGYNSARPDCPIVTTFYVYPTPRMIFIGATPEAAAGTDR